MDIEGSDWRVLFGSCLDRLRDLPDNSVDSIVTDPPYELGFMGKAWDSSGIAYNIEVWRECLRVLKPGGHLLAFSGSRTYHRMTVAIEDAGFEVRDMIAWISNKTFPKSLDVSKAIDKQRGDRDAIAAVARRMREMLEATGKSKSELDEMFGTKNVAQYWFSPERNPQIVPAERWPIVREWLGAGSELDAEVWRLNGRKGQPGEAWAEREVIGQRDVPKGHAFAGETYGGDSSTRTIDETVAATEQAKQWQGWGTALKPTVEPIVMARKPLIGTVAENVLKYGTGGLNIDGTRIAHDDSVNLEAVQRQQANNPIRFGGAKPGDVVQMYKPGGRWPANVMLDEWAAAIVDEQSGVSKSPKPYGGQGYKDSSMFGVGGINHANEYGDKGGASRFFYVARASKRDRNEGLDERANVHPTVKPTDLMRYLIKLVTPPGGTVLDPFTGSGSTGKAAILEGFKFIGVELTEEYLPIIEGRLQHAAATVAKQAAEQAEAESEVLF